MSDKNIRLVYSVLQKVSKDRGFVEQSFKLWHSQNDTTKAIDLDKLIAFFEQEVGLNQDEKRTFRIAFYSGKGRSLDELPIVPRILTSENLQTSNGSINQHPETESTDSLSSLSHSEYTFSVFINNLLSFAKRIDDDSLADIIDYFSDKKTLSKMKLSGMTTKSVLSWIGQDLNENINAQNMSEKDMQNIFHNVYISLCESLGPVDTDRVLSKSLDRTEKDPKTANYPSSNFI